MPRIEGIAAHSLMCRVLQLFPESCAETQDLYFPQGVKYPPKGGSLLLATLAIYKDEDEDEDELLQALLWRFKVFYSLTSGAIVHLHEQGMVHGDMNLGNIMLYGLTEELMDGVIGDFDSLTQARDAHNSALLIDAPFSMPAGQAMFVNELKPNVAGSWLWSPERLGRELSPEFHERIFKGMSSEQEKRACALEIFFTVNGLTARPVFDWYTYIYGCLHVQLGPQVLGSYEAVDFLLRLQEALDSLPDASTHKTVEFFLNRSLELMINAKLPDKVSSALLGMQGPDLSAVIPVVLIQTCIPIHDQALREGVEAASTVSGSPFCVDQVGGRLFTAGGEGSAFSPPSGLSGGGAAASQGTLSPR